MSPYYEAAHEIFYADAVFLLIGTGIDDDDPPDGYTGPQDFWRTTPALSAHGLTFGDALTLENFVKKPRLAWAAYVEYHKFVQTKNTARKCKILQELCYTRKHPEGRFICTTTTDGTMRSSAFDDVYYRVSLAKGCVFYARTVHKRNYDESIVDMDQYIPDIRYDPGTMSADLKTVPFYPRILKQIGCKRESITKDARDAICPNIFGEIKHEPSIEITRRDFIRFHQENSMRFVVLEIGAENTDTTIRDATRETMRLLPHAKLIRVNKHDARVPRGHTSIRADCGSALEAIFAEHREIIRKINAAAPVSAFAKCFKAVCLD